MQSEVSSQKQEVKVFVISPIHHPETAQAAICWCLGAATAERSSHISLRLTVIIYSLCWAKLSLHESWSPRGRRLLVAEPTGEHTYTAASNLMSLHMRSQQGKGMPAVSILLYWPYISAGCQCRGLHPERLRRQKQLDEKTDRRAWLCLPKLICLRKKAPCRLTITARL